MVLGLSYMDLAFIIILLISGITGAIKGFAKIMFSFLSFIIIVLVAGLLCEWVGGLLYPVFGKAIEGGFADWIKSNDVIVQIEGVGEVSLFNSPHDWTDSSKIDLALSSLGIPALIHNILTAIIYPTFASFGKEAVLAEKLPPVLARWVVNVIAFIILALVIALILFFIKRAVFKAISKKPTLNRTNRILGCIVSLFYTYSMMSVILMIVGTLVTSMGLFTGVQEFFASQSNASANGWFPIFRFMYHHNFIGEFIIKQFLMMIPK
ncbi:MAG: hypothetical protein E7353_05210 [Clostridiales bacterium]|nr:hypothetical protein [Clostridiales bacterium]